MPVGRWFIHRKFSSFQRQLNIYNFVRITHGDDAGCYYHELFQRGQEHLLYRIKRVPIKKDVPPNVTNRLMPLEATNLRVDKTSRSSPGISARIETLLQEPASHQHENNRMNHLETESTGAATVEWLQRHSDQHQIIQHGILSNRSLMPLMPSGGMVLNADQIAPSTRTISELQLMLAQNSGISGFPFQSAELLASIVHLQREELTMVESTQSIPSMIQHERFLLSRLQSASSVAANNLSHLLQREQHDQQSRLILDTLQREQSVAQSRLILDSHPVLRASDHIVARNLSSLTAINERNALLRQLMHRRSDELQLSLMNGNHSYLPPVVVRFITNASVQDGNSADLHRCFFP
jgi:HSF-type DNA-binding